MLQRHFGLKAGIPAYAIGAYVAASRMADNRHFPSDLVMGAAVGIVSGAWMGGTRGVLLMQTSGFATLPNVLASLCVPYQIPMIMVVTERGTLGEFNIGQGMVCRTMRPTLDTLNIEHHTLTDTADVPFVLDRGIKQALATQAQAIASTTSVEIQRAGGRGIVSIAQRRQAAVAQQLPGASIAVVPVDRPCDATTPASEVAPDSRQPVVAGSWSHVEPPRQLFSVDPAKIVGLTIDPELAAISVLHLETGIAAALHDDRIAVPASLYKVGVLAEAYRQIEAGTLRTDEPLRLLPTDWAPGAGILQGRIGSQVSVADALRLMIGISDNVAAHAIVRRIGVDHVNANNQRLGLAETRYYVDDRPDTTTASDMARLLSLLAQGKVAGPEATAQMIALMRQVQPAAWLPKGVPGTVPVAHKSGQLGGVRNDAGIVYGPTGPYVVVVLTDNRRDPSLGERTITSVARSVHAFFAAGG